MPEVVLSVEDPPLKQDVAKMSGKEVMQFLKDKRLLESDLGYLTLTYDDGKKDSQISFAFHDDQTVLLVFEEAKGKKRWAIQGKERSGSTAIGDENMAKLSNFVEGDTAAKAVDHFIKTGEKEPKLKWDIWEPISDDEDPDIIDEDEEFTAKDKDFLDGLGGFDDDEFDDDDW